MIALPQTPFARDCGASIVVIESKRETSGLPDALSGVPDVFAYRSATGMSTVCCSCQNASLLCEGRCPCRSDIPNHIVA